MDCLGILIIYCRLFRKTLMDYVLTFFFLENWLEIIHFNIFCKSKLKFYYKCKYKLAFFNQGMLMFIKNINTLISLIENILYDIN